MPARKTTRKKKRLRTPRQRPRVLVFSYWPNEQVMDAVLDEAKCVGWEMVDVRFLHGTTARAFAPDGVLFCRPAQDAEWARCLETGCPIVHIGLRSSAVTARNVAMVMPDFEKAGVLAAKHFIERGYRNVACRFQKGLFHDLIADPVLRGFDRVVEGNRLTRVERVRLPDMENGYESFAASAAAWLVAAPRPVGFFVWGDVLGGHLCAVCRSQGIAVPEEVAILGAGNKRWLCKLSPCPLSSVDLNGPEQGREAVRLLQRLMTGEAPPAVPVLIPPAGVVTRRSTDILAVDDTTVARALRFIWEHCAEPLSVEDVAVAVGVSGKTLERRFRKALDRTVNQELLRKRLDECRRLLISTSDSVADIAPRIGFPSKSYLHRSFRRVYGASPQTYRKQWRAGLQGGTS